MPLKVSIAFVGGTSLEIEADSFMVDPGSRILAIVSGSENYAFPLENLRYWRMRKQSVVQ